LDFVEGSGPLALGREFYARSTLAVARDLLGTVLVHSLPDGERRSGRIVETEAYLGPEDLASHARSGPRARAALMWGEVGVAYVYLVYGIHHCFNVVAKDEGAVGAILVRALDPLEVPVGMRTSGPGLVSRALEIDRSHNGLDLVHSSLVIERGESVPDSRVLMGPRIGVTFAGDWALHPWRFWDGSSAWVSGVRRGRAFDPDALL
jgi:DNA-3-methyladenine glycosylase